VSREDLRSLIKNPNAGHVALLLVIIGGGGANYTKVDEVSREIAAMRTELIEYKLERRDLERRLAKLEMVQ
jgi:cell division protein FtsB